ncbi:hypothetical protein Nepgr_019175 [Nepenthes gracilis]|uniref:Uncharacterized protein n=1 Tax=Nepenthes gracilis TaxID=150966 RepID=A0AAD3SUY1_NEPGR|nr:hypothetical protein Nepgr_019175 [Nepenthes gracilis]
MQQPREINIDDYPVDDMEMAPANVDDYPMDDMEWLQPLPVGESTLDELLSIDPKIFISFFEDSTLDDFSSTDPIALSEYMSKFKKLLDNDPVPSEFMSEQPGEINVNDFQVDEMAMAIAVASQGCPHQTELEEMSTSDKLMDMDSVKSFLSKDSTPDDFSSADPIALSEHMSKFKKLLGNDPEPSEFISEQPGEINVDDFQVDEMAMAIAVASQGCPHPTELEEMSTSDKLMDMDSVKSFLSKDSTPDDFSSADPIALSEHMQPGEINVDDFQVDEMAMAIAVASQGCPHQTELEEMSTSDKLMDMDSVKSFMSKDSTPDDFSSADPIALSEHMDNRWRSTLTEEQRLKGWEIRKFRRSNGSRSDKIYIHKQSDWRFRSEIEVNNFVLDGLGPKHIQRKAQMQGQDNTPNASVAKKRGTKRAESGIPTLKEQAGSLDLRIPLLRDSNNLVLYDIVMKPPKDTTSKATRSQIRQEAPAWTLRGSASSICGGGAFLAEGSCLHVCETSFWMVAIARLLAEGSPLLCEVLGSRGLSCLYFPVFHRGSLLRADDDLGIPRPFPALPVSVLLKTHYLRGPELSLSEILDLPGSCWELAPLP